MKQSKSPFSLPVYDAFEPSFVEDAMRHAPELCPAIFENIFWSSHKSEIDEQPWVDNPLFLKDIHDGAHF